MVNTKDDFLHDIRLPDFVESYRISTISKRDKWYSFSIFSWDPSMCSISIHSLYNFLDYSVTNHQIIKDANPKKTIGTQRSKYSILQPLKESKLIYKDSSISNIINIYDHYPYNEALYAKPLSLSNIEDMIRSYFTRCRAKVSIELNTASKVIKKNIDCIGFREHSWGLYPYPHINCDSRVIVHIRDQTIAFRYIEYAGINHSYGCILHKSGNLALVLIELEFLSIKNGILESSEFTYKDAQDDIDLIVSKPIKTHTLEVAKNCKKTHIHVVSFSDFTIIGTNKKGYGIEEHFIAKQRLQQI